MKTELPTIPIKHSKRMTITIEYHYPEDIEPILATITKQKGISHKTEIEYLRDSIAEINGELHEIYRSSV